MFDCCHIAQKAGWQKIAVLIFNRLFDRYSIDIIIYSNIATNQKSNSRKNRNYELSYDRNQNVKQLF